MSFREREHAGEGAVTTRRRRWRVSAIHISLMARLEYWKDGSWYVGQLRDVPGVFSQGRTLDELRANIRDAYALMLHGR